MGCTEVAREADVLMFRYPVRVPLLLRPFAIELHSVQASAGQPPRSRCGSPPSFFKIQFLLNKIPLLLGQQRWVEGWGVAVACCAVRKFS